MKTRKKKLQTLSEALKTNLRRRKAPRNNDAKEQERSIDIKTNKTT